MLRSVMRAGGVWFRAFWEKTGSAKAIIGFGAGVILSLARNVLMLEIDGSTVTANFLMSQSMSLRFLPVGSFVTSTPRGIDVSAPLAITDNRFLPAILSAIGPKIS